MIPRLASIVKPADFHDPRHATLWDAFLAVHGRGEPVDVLTVVAELRRATGSTPSAGRSTSAISPTRSRRSRTASRTRGSCSTWRPGGVRWRPSRGLGAAAGGRPAGGGADPGGQGADGRRGHAPAALVGDDLDALMDTVWERREGRQRPLSTPWAGWTRGARRRALAGDVRARRGTGAGKTQWAVQVAVEAALKGHHALPRARALAAGPRRPRARRALGVPVERDPAGQVDGPALGWWPRRCGGRGRCRSTPVRVPFGYRADTLASRAWALRPSLVVLDYLQLCAGAGRGAAGDGGARVVRGPHDRARPRRGGAGALEHGPGELRRAGERPDQGPRRPRRARQESGEIEYAADGVAVLARRGDDPGQRVLVVSKNRHGPLGRVELRWSGTAFGEGDAPAEAVEL